MDKEEQGHWDHALMVNKLTEEIERLREKVHYHYEQGYWDHVLMVNKLTNEIEKLREERNQLRKVLRMWVDFWVADNSIDVGGDALLAEEAMEATREILGDNNV